MFAVLHSTIAYEDADTPERKAQVFQLLNLDHSPVLAVDLEFEPLGQAPRIRLARTVL